MTCLQVHWFFLVLDWICYWTTLVKFSIQLLYFHLQNFCLVLFFMVCIFKKFYLEANCFIILWWFFAIHWHESAMGVHVFPILNPPPTSLPIPSLWFIPWTSPEHPVSCIEPGLVIHFTYEYLHVSMPFSHIILPSPSPTESQKTVLYICFLLLFKCL